MSACANRAWISVVVSLAIAGCASAVEPDPPPRGPFAEALAEISAGGTPGSLGVGWADPQLVSRSGGGPRLVAEALGPNADTVVEGAGALGRRFGLDALRADQLVSVGGSYAFGLRLDGLDGDRLRRALIAAGGHARPAGNLELVAIGDYAVVPDPLLDADVNGLGAFDAFGPEVVVLAISDRARASPLGRSTELLAEPVYGAAASCLGGVVAARLVPDKLLLSIELGIVLVAVGIREDGSEVLCAVGGTAARADQVASALRASLSRPAPDPVTGDPIAHSVAAASISTLSYRGVEAVRAELSLTRKEAPGFVFGALARGSVVGLINGSSETFIR